MNSYNLCKKDAKKLGVTMSKEWYTKFVVYDIFGTNDVVVVKVLNICGYLVGLIYLLHVAIVSLISMILPIKKYLNKTMNTKFFTSLYIGATDVVIDKQRITVDENCMFTE